MHIALYIYQTGMRHGYILLKPYPQNRIFDALFSVCSYFQCYLASYLTTLAPKGRILLSDGYSGFQFLHYFARILF